MLTGGTRLLDAMKRHSSSGGGVIGSSASAGAITGGGRASSLPLRIAERTSALTHSSSSASPTSPSPDTSPGNDYDDWVRATVALQRLEASACQPLLGLLRASLGALSDPALPRDFDACALATITTRSGHSRNSGSSRSSSSSDTVASSSLPALDTHGSTLRSPLSGAAHTSPSSSSATSTLTTLR